MRILRALYEAGELTRESLCDRAEMSDSGSFATYIGKLRSLELIEKVPGGFKVSEELK